VCPILGLLVTSNHDTNAIDVFHLPSSADIAGAASGGLQPELTAVRVCTIGGPDAPPHFQFKFTSGSGGASGRLAFAGPPLTRILLVIDAGNDAVHAIDGATWGHAGYLAAPGTIAGPSGVAARGSLVAITAWKTRGVGDHVVRLYEGSPACGWAPLRTLAGGFGSPGRADGQLCHPRGVRFTSDGSGVAVIDSNRVSH
jgi:hypothetical protein